MYSMFNCKCLCCPKIGITKDQYHRIANGLEDVDIQSRLVNELRLRARQRQRYSSMQGRMFAAWDQYRAGDQHQPYTSHA